MRVLRALAISAVLMLAATVPAARAGAPALDGAGRATAPPVMPANPPLAFKRDCESAESGDADAAYRMARRFLFGQGVVRDRRVGAAWLRAAASRGHAEARKLIAYVPGEVGRIRPYCRPGGAPPRGVVAPPEEIGRIVRALAPSYGLDPALVLAVIQVESAFRTDAVSPKEAAGLMQLIPETAERFAVRDVFDPQENIRGGMKYLRWLLAYFSGDVTLALAGYNAGEGAVDRHRGVPPYEETRAYVQLIRRLYAHADHPFDPAAAAPSPVIPRRTAALAR